MGFGFFEARKRYGHKISDLKDYVNFMGGIFSKKRFVSLHDYWTTFFGQRNRSAYCLSD